MNWSEYSRFVGDVFGAPLALEGLVAFFLESTFLGLWIFGWGRLPSSCTSRRIWLVAIGVNASAYFIIAANSFMQHPVGAHLQPETGRAELTSIWELLTNNTALAAFPHAVAGAFLTAGDVRRRHRRLVDGAQHAQVASEATRNSSRRRSTTDTDAATMFRPVTILALWVMVIAWRASDSLTPATCRAS